MAQENGWEIRPEEFSYQFAYFHRLTPGDTLLGGERARKFFLQSGLSYDILGAIWSLSDVDLDGQLSAAEYTVAMRLVHALISGRSLPATLPQALVNFLEAVTHAKLAPPADNHLQKCRSAFVSFQTNNGKGVLGAEAARYLLMKSNLPRETIIHIWTLADVDKDGYLTFLEFTAAMHLIYVTKLGHFLPLKVDAHTIFPPSVGGREQSPFSGWMDFITCMPYLYYTFIGDIQRAADQLPLSHQPYVDPITPQGTPTLVDNRFISLQHFTLPPEAFRDREYDTFVGNPFEPMLEGDRDAPDQGVSSVCSSPSAGSRGSSIVKEVVVEERTEPVVQLVGSVEILAPPGKVEVGELRRDENGEREMEEEGEGEVCEEDAQKVEEEAAEERGEREESSEREEKDRDNDDLEDISRASHKFLEESRDVFEEDLQWVTPVRSVPFGIDQYRSASMKGLSETIEEMGIGGDDEGKSGEESRIPVLSDHTFRATSPHSGAARVISHMQQLEAQIMSALADTSSLLPEGQGEEPYDLKDTNALLQEMLNQKSEYPVAEPQRQLEPLEQHRKSLERSLETVIKVTNEPPPTRDAPSKRTSSPSIVPSEQSLSATEVQSNASSKTKAPAVPTEVQNNASSKTKAQNNASTTVTIVTTNAPAPSKGNPTTCSGRDKKPAKQQPSMDDLDSILGDELASINDVFAEFEATDRKSKAPAFNVTEQPKRPVSSVLVNVPSLDTIRKKKEEESKIIAQQWEEEARRIEQEKLREMEVKKALVQESDSTVQTLENEWKTLLQQEEQQVREAQKEKEARLIREQEEQARLAKEREEAKAKAKLTPEELPLEEWIEWVEKNRVKEMTPEQRIEYEHKKQQRAAALREKEEQRKREEEERLRRARQKMSDEQRMHTARETDIKVSRIDTEELRRLQEQNAKKEAEEKRQREEKAKQWKERVKQAEIEELKPKAQSSLAARWEEKIKNRNASSKDYKSTVLGTEGMKATRKSSTGH